MSCERFVLFVSHDASRTGAPAVLLRLQGWLRENTQLAFRTVVLKDGPLVSEFQSLAQTTVLTRVGPGRVGWIRRVGRMPVIGPALKGQWSRFLGSRVAGGTPALVYANTVATAGLIDRLAPPASPVLLHVHELENAIQIAAGAGGMQRLKQRATHYIAASEPVRENLVQRHRIDAAKVDMVPEFINVAKLERCGGEVARRSSREVLGIPEDAVVLCGCGATTARKGADLFVEMAEIVARECEDLNPHFLWIGEILKDDFSAALMRKVNGSEFVTRFRFPGVHLQPASLMAGADLFVLSSREDPLPLVALEAASVAKPVICFSGGGGIAGFVAGGAGVAVDEMSASALADAVGKLVRNRPAMASAGLNALVKVRAENDVGPNSERIWSIMRRVGGLG